MVEEPVSRTYERVQYIPVETQIVHYPERENYVPAVTQKRTEYVGQVIGGAISNHQQGNASYVSSGSYVAGQSNIGNTQAYSGVNHGSNVGNAVAYTTGPTYATNVSHTVYGGGNAGQAYTTGNAGQVYTTGNTGGQVYTTGNTGTYTTGSHAIGGGSANYATGNGATYTTSSYAPTGTYVTSGSGVRAGGYVTGGSGVRAGNTSNMSRTSNLKGNSYETNVPYY